MLERRKQPRAQRTYASPKQCATGRRVTEVEPRQPVRRRRVLRRRIRPEHKPLLDRAEKVVDDLAGFIACRPDPESLSEAQASSCARSAVKSVRQRAPASA